MFGFGINISKFALGEMHCHDTSHAQSIPAGATYTKLTHHTSTETAQNITSIADVGVNNEFIIIIPGWYRIVATSSSYIASPNITFRFALFVNETEYDQIHSESKFPPGDRRTGLIQGVIYCSAGDKISIRARHDKITAENLIVTYANFNMEYIK